MSLQELEKSFSKLIKNSYDNSSGYFTSQLFDEPVNIQPHLLKFVPCSDEACDCRDDTQIKSDAQSFGAKTL